MFPPFAGLTVLSSPHAFQLVVTEERTFPASQHRSRRIHKKLVKRHGGEYKVVRKPCALQVGNVLFVHPSIYEEFKRRYKT